MRQPTFGDNERQRKIVTIFNSDAVSRKHLTQRKKKKFILLIDTFILCRITLYSFASFSAGFAAAKTAKVLEFFTSLYVTHDGSL
jgi:hypothetical protein